MASFNDRIDINAPPEAVYQSLRRWALAEGRSPKRLLNLPAMPALPVYEFGRMLNQGSADCLSEKVYLACANAASARARDVGFQLPHACTAFIFRYEAKLSTPAYLHIAVGLEEDDCTAIEWYQWDRRQDWFVLAQALIDGGLKLRLLRPATEEETTLYRNTLMTTISVAQHLIFEGSGGVQRDAKPPGISKGRSKPHPLAPSSVVEIRVDRVKLERSVTPRSSDGRILAGHNRAGATPHYNHPRFKNVRGTVGVRRPTLVNGGGPAKTYHMRAPDEQ